MTNKKRQPIPFSVRLCSDKAAFEVRIPRKISFNMTDLERLLKSVKENEIIVNTPHIVIFRSKGAEVTLSRNGRMLIKKVRNEKEATAVASEVLRVLSLISEVDHLSSPEYLNKRIHEEMERIFAQVKEENPDME